MPMLDIIVTHYKEPWEVGSKFFAMLDLQRGIDFSQIHVIVVNDGKENMLPNEHFQNRPYSVEQISIQHAGVSAARNAGLRTSTAEWVAFCDFDDTYTHIYSLKTVLDILPAYEYDMLRGELIAEDFLNGNTSLTLSPEIACMVFLHGKFYRRKFLIDHDIWFDEEQNFNEDSEFNAIINTYVDYKRTGEIKTFAPIYSWCRRPMSVTSTPGRDDAATWGHYRRNKKVLEATRKRMPIDHYRGMVTRVCYDTYLMCQSKLVSAEMKKKIYEDFKPFYMKHRLFFGVDDPDVLKQIIDIAKAELAKEEEDIPVDETILRKWLNKIEKEVKE